MPSLMKQLRKILEPLLPAMISVLPKLTAIKSVMLTSVRRLVVEVAAVVVPRTSPVSIARRTRRLLRRLRSRLVVMKIKRRVLPRLTPSLTRFSRRTRARWRQMRMTVVMKAPLSRRRILSLLRSLPKTLRQLRPPKVVPSSQLSLRRLSRCLICLTWPQWASLWACRCRRCLVCPAPILAPSPVSQPSK